MTRAIVRPSGDERSMSPWTVANAIPGPLSKILIAAFKVGGLAGEPI